MIGVLLSIIIPGLGQIYFGKNMRGIVMIIMTLVPFLYPVALVWSIIDAVNLSKKSIPPAFSKKEAVGILVVIFIIIPVFVFFTWTIAFSSLNYISNKTIKPNKVKEEGNEIVLTINKYKNTEGKLPSQISDLIEGKPLRQSWTTDPWKEFYIYEVNEDGSDYLLKSKGQDKISGTKDDIIIHNY